MSDTTLTEQIEIVPLREVDAGTDNACWFVCSLEDLGAVEFVPLSALEAAEKRTEEAEKESRLANELVDSYAASFKKLAVTIGYERGGLGAQALAENLVSERDTLRAEVRKLREVLLNIMDQAESDLAEAHKEICKLQGLDSGTHEWPEWSSPANTIRWFASVRKTFGLTKKEPSDGQG